MPRADLTPESLSHGDLFAVRDEVHPHVLLDVSASNEDGPIYILLSTENYSMTYMPAMPEWMNADDDPLACRYTRETMTKILNQLDAERIL